jgi:cobalt/nickel transport system permease protein
MKLIPFLGMASAFTFLIMMFNIPIPGGSSGHAVGAALIALILGPWVAVISVSVALVLQALIFGDGGITAIGANCFNMAVVMPFVAYFVFKIIKGKSDNLQRMSIAAFFAGYISLCIAAIVTAVELGIQPLIAVSPQGQPLHSPYPLSIALPVMAIENLLVFGIVEGIITAILFKYFYKNNNDLIEVIKH